jgi:UDP-N-acetylmuramoyl-L-alanyl-D-glutamate--2,6-diaminopimelate ligase
VTVAELLRDAGVSPIRTVGTLDREVLSLADDSRAVGPGAFFFAMPGAQNDGRQFAAAAVGAGAVAVATPTPIELPAETTVVELPEIRRDVGRVAASFYGHPSRRLELVGVTGTNGKTTVTWILESIWKCAGRRPGIIGTIEYRGGNETWAAPFTTPRPILLQSVLRSMADSGISTVAMEVSSHGLMLDRVEECEWNGAVFTNLTHDHLDFHDDLEDYFRAKARLFTELLPASPKSDRFSVIHWDDPFGKRLVAMTPGRVVTFGRTVEADVAPGETMRSLDGWSGTLRVAGEHFEFRSSLVGEAHLDNILAATAVAAAQGIPHEKIAAGLEACEGVPGRMERVNPGSECPVFVDYAHTPDALQRSLHLLRELTHGRLVVVFGCGGDRDRAKRPVMGRAAAALGDVVVVTSDNPRTEKPKQILAEIESGIRLGGMAPVGEGESGRGYVVIENRRRAIAHAIELAAEGDVVLIAGKGHETYQILGNERFDFDDRIEARRCLESGA